MRIEFTPLCLAILAGSFMISVVIVLCTWVMASMLSACRIETAKIRKWFTE